MPQIGKSLDACNACSVQVGFELQRLQADLEEVPLTDVACLEPGFCDLQGLAKAGKIFGGELQVRPGQECCNELLSYVECQCALCVGHLRACDLCSVLCRLFAPLSFLAAFEQIPDTKVILLSLVKVFHGEGTWSEDGQELRVPLQHRIRP